MLTHFSIWKDVISFEIITYCETFKGSQSKKDYQFFLLDL